jgi:hypothetical protein
MIIINGYDGEETVRVRLTTACGFAELASTSSRCHDCQVEGRLQLVRQIAVMVKML